MTKKPKVPEWKLIEGKRWTIVTSIKDSSRTYSCIHSKKGFVTQKEAEKIAKGWEDKNWGRTKILKIGDYYYIYGRHGADDIPEYIVKGKKKYSINQYRHLQSGNGPDRGFSTKVEAEKTIKEYKLKRTKVMKVGKFYYIYYELNRGI